MTGTIKKVVELSIADGKLGEFKAVVAVFIERVDTSEPGTLRYEWYLDVDGARCLVLEEYRDSEALLTHLDNIRDLYEPLFKVSRATRVEVLGNPSEKARQAHLAGTNFLGTWASISR